MMAPEDVQIKIQSQTNTVSHRTTAGFFCVGTVVVVVVVEVEGGGVRCLLSGCPDSSATAGGDPVGGERSVT